jgi:hypothetical protein
VILGEVADIVRSKNAGINHITIEVMFNDADTYERVKETNCINLRTISELYGLPEEKIDLYKYDPGLSFKIVLPLGYTSGSPRDRDLRGAQQHAPVFHIECDIEG